MTWGGGEHKKHMHKHELARKIAQKTDLDEKAALQYLKIALAEITASLKKGKRVTLTGFGSFEIRKRKKRKMNNIVTGEPLIVPAHKSVGFSVGQTLKRSVR